MKSLVEREKKPARLPTSYNNMVQPAIDFWEASHSLLRTKPSPMICMKTFLANATVKSSEMVYTRHASTTLLPSDRNIARLEVHYKHHSTSAEDLQTRATLRHGVAFKMVSDEGFYECMNPISSV